VLKGHAERIDSLFSGLEKHEQVTMLALLQKLEAHLRAVAPRSFDGSRAAPASGTKRKQKPRD